MPKLGKLDDQPTMRELYALYPEVLAPLGEFHEKLMRGPSPFSQGERELIAAYVSALNACRYCAGVHVEVAKACGMDATFLEALIDNPEKAPTPQNMKPVLALAKKLTEAPARVLESDTDALRQAGWDEDAIFFTVAVAALFNLNNRLVDGVGLEAPDGYNRAAGHRLSTMGYDLLPKDS